MPKQCHTEGGSSALCLSQEEPSGFQNVPRSSGSNQSGCETLPSPVPPLNPETAKRLGFQLQNCCRPPPRQPHLARPLPRANTERHQVACGPAALLTHKLDLVPNYVLNIIHDF
jgi:hypothetical protein